MGGLGGRACARAYREAAASRADSDARAGLSAGRVLDPPYQRLTGGKSRSPAPTPTIAAADARSKSRKVVRDRKQLREHRVRDSPAQQQGTDDRREAAPPAPGGVRHEPCIQGKQREQVAGLLEVRPEAEAVAVPGDAGQEEDAERDREVRRELGPAAADRATQAGHLRD